MSIVNPTFVVTAAGIAAHSYAIANGQPFNISSFKVGNAYGYTPTAADTNLHGTVLHTGAPYSFNIIDTDTWDILLVMDTNIGPFSFGEVGLYCTVPGYNLDQPVLYALACYDALRPKIATSGSIIGDRWKLHALMRMAQGVANIIINATATMLLPEVATWAALPTPSGMPVTGSNAAIVQEADPFGNYSVVVKKDNSNWTVLGYIQIGSDTISSSNTTTFQAPFLSTLALDGTTSRRYLAKFADGSIRALSGISGGVATMTGSKSPAPTGVVSLWQSINYSDEFKAVATLADLPPPATSGVAFVKVGEKDSFGYNPILAYAVSTTEWSFLTHQNFVAAGSSLSGTTASVIVATLPSNLLPASPSSRRYILQMTSGPAAGTARFISGYTYNSGTGQVSINVSANFGVSPGSGNTFAIYQENEEVQPHTPVATWSLLGRVQDNPPNRNSFLIQEARPCGAYPIAYAKSSSEWGVIGYNWLANGTITASSTTSVTAAVFTNLKLDTTTNRRLLLKFSSGYVRPVTSVAGGVATIPTLSPAPTGSFEILQATETALNTRKMPSINYLTAPSTLPDVDFVLTGTTDESGGNPVIASPVNGSEWAFLSHNHRVALGGALSGSSTSLVKAGVSSSLLEPTPAAGKYILQFITGALAGTVRPVTAFNGDFTVNPAFASPPVAGDAYIVYQSNTSKAGTLGGVFARNSIMSGRTDVYGNPSYLSAGTGLSVNLLADSASPFIVSWANGFSLTTGNPQDHILPPVSATIAGAWSGLPASALVALFYERDLVSGVVSRSWHYNQLRYSYDLTAVDSIPEMSSASAPYGSVTASSSLVGRDGYKAFDSDLTPGSGWATAGPTGTLAYMFPGNIGGVAKKYTIQPNQGNTGYHSQEYFYTGSAQSYTVPAGVTSITVTVVGGGGGGGGGAGIIAGNTNYQWTGGGGGGGGGGLTYTTLSVTPGQVITVNIGAGGTLGVSTATANTSGTSDGGAGGNTTLVSGVTLATATGGAGGNRAYGAGSGGYPGGVWGTAGAGGTGSYTGGSGGRGVAFGVGPSGGGGLTLATAGTGSGSTSYSGGNGYWSGGGGGRGGLTLGPAVVPTTVGVGGQGGMSAAFASYGGTVLPAEAGAPGYVKVEWNTGSSSTCPKAWTFEGYNGSSWVTLDTQSGVTSWVGRRVFAISNAVSYRGYRLNITDTVAAGSIEIDDFEVMLADQAVFHLGQKVAYKYAAEGDWRAYETNQVGVAVTGASATTSVVMEPIVPRSLVSGGYSDLNQPGTLAAFAMNSPPAGWLRANGAAVSRVAYANLFNAIGTTFGSGDGFNTFNVPDARGEFLRGYDDGRGVDTGRVFGSAQTDLLASHSHTFTSHYGSLNVTSPQLLSNLTDNVSPTTQTTDSTGGSETRPRNLALLMCIKY